MRKLVITFLCMFPLIVSAQWAGLPITNGVSSYADWNLLNTNQYIQQLWGAAHERVIAVGYRSNNLSLYRYDVSGSYVSSYSTNVVSSNVVSGGVTNIWTYTNFAPNYSTVTITNDLISNAVFATTAIVSCYDSPTHQTNATVTALTGGVLGQIFSSLFYHLCGNGQLDYYVPQNRDLDAWFSTAAGDGTYPTYFPDLGSVPFFFYELGTNFVGDNGGNFGNPIGVDKFGGYCGIGSIDSRCFARDSSPRGALLAQVAYTNNGATGGWSFIKLGGMQRNYTNTYSKTSYQTILANPVVVFLTTNSRCPVTISGDTVAAYSDSEYFSAFSGATNTLTKQWLVVTNILLSPSLSVSNGVSVTVQYTNGSILFLDDSFESVSIAYNYYPKAELNANAINQRYKIFHAAQWAQYQGTWTVTPPIARAKTLVPLYDSNHNEKKVDWSSANPTIYWYWNDYSNGPVSLKETSVPGAFPAISSTSVSTNPGGYWPRDAPLALAKFNFKYQ